jgi:subtilisin family serine protease
MKIKKQIFLTSILVIIGLVISNATVSINLMSSADNTVKDIASRPSEILVGDNEEIVSVLVYLKDQVDLDKITRQMDEQRATLQVRHETIVLALQNTAYATQPQLVEYLDELQRQEIVKEFKCFWIGNIIRVDTYQSVVDQIAKRDDVLRVYPNYGIELIDPVVENPDGESGNKDDIEIGVIAVRAPEVWDMGITGEGVLVATLDTGVDGNHPALAERWAGVADPRYEGHPEWAWFDPYLNQNDFPYDNHGHGTHTMGTVCGGAPGDQVGVAPGALWISAAPIDRGGGIQGTVDDAIESFEWLVDPDGNPSTNWDVPDVCSNSWRLTTGHGYPPCDDLFWCYLDACEAAGTVIIFSAGNEGYGGLGRPPDRATDDYRCFAVAAVDANDPSWPIAGFSSRGPTYCTPDGSEAIKPDIAAPGVSVRSSTRGGGYGYKSGTSMASPHINGVVALMRQFSPDISVEEVKEIIYQTAYDLGDPGEDNSYGWGMVDAYKAVMSINKNPYTPSKPVGPNVWAQYMTATLQTTTTDPEGDSISYMFDWGDGNNSGWVGPYGSGQTAEASYAWSKIGEYEIRTKAKDKDYGESDWSEPHILTIVENEPPEKPIITGPKTGKPMSLLTFKVSAEDPEGNDLSYLVSWGDGHYIPYQGPYASGEEATFSHSWSTTGDYTIAVKARDQYGAKGPQSNFRLSITKTRAVYTPFQWFLQQHLNLFPILRLLIQRLGLFKAI